MAIDDRFDPTVRHVLEAIGHGAGAATTERELIDRLAPSEGDGEPSGSTGNHSQVRDALRQLVENGLVQRTDAGYVLTHLGRARVAQQHREEDEQREG